MKTMRVVTPVLVFSALSVMASLGVARVVSAQADRPLGADFILASGQRVTLTGTSLSIRFDKVENDSRCPKEGQCIWAGDAEVHLVLTTAGGGSDRAPAPRAVVLHTNGDPRQIVQDGLEVRLVGLAPVPSLEKPPSPQDYRATLHVARQTAK